MPFLFLANPPGFENNFEVTTSRIGVTNEYQCNVRVISPISRASASSLDLVILVSVQSLFLCLFFPFPAPSFFFFKKEDIFRLHRRYLQDFSVHVTGTYWWPPIQNFAHFITCLPSPLTPHPPRIFLWPWILSLTWLVLITLKKKIV